MSLDKSFGSVKVIFGKSEVKSWVLNTSIPYWLRDGLVDGMMATKSETGDNYEVSFTSDEVNSIVLDSNIPYGFRSLVYLEQKQQDSAKLEKALNDDDANKLSIDTNTDIRFLMAHLDLGVWNDCENMYNKYTRKQNIETWMGVLNGLDYDNAAAIVDACQAKHYQNKQYTIAERAKAMENGY